MQLSSLITCRFVERSGLNPSCTSSSTPCASNVTDSLCAQMPVMIFAAVFIRQTGRSDSKIPSSPAFFTSNFVYAPSHSTGKRPPALTLFTACHRSSLISSGASCHISYVNSSGPELFPFGSFFTHSLNSSQPTDLVNIGLFGSSLPFSNRSSGIGHGFKGSASTVRSKCLH